MAGPSAWRSRGLCFAAVLALVGTSMAAFAPGAAAADAPVNTAAPSIGGKTFSSSTLTATSGSWATDGTPLLFYNSVWQWQRCDASLTCTTSQTDESSLATDSYLLTDADIGYSIRVLVTATDEFVDPGATSVPAASGTTAVITASGAPTEDATAFAGTLAGPGVSVSSATFTGAPTAVGTFSAQSAVLGLSSGVGISTGLFAGGSGCTKGIQGPNECTNNSTDFGYGGNPALTALSGQRTFDAAGLSIAFVPTYSTLSFQYVFGSEEYDEYANTAYNDVFAFYVNGVNCALVPGTDEPVSVDTINDGNPNGDATAHHPELFHDNTDGHLNTELDGVTSVLTCRATVIPDQVNTLSLQIADATDALYDSAVFVGAGTITSSDTGVATTLTAGSTSSPTVTVAPGTAVTDSATLTGTNAAAATGSLSYTVYSDSACADPAGSGGTATVAGASVPASSPVTLISSGTYYWQAVYSGDQANNPASSTCGAVTEIVAPDTTSLRYTGSSAGTYSQPLLLAATLTDTATGRPLAGKTVTFIVGSGSSAQTITTAPSDSTGNATATLPQLNSVAPSTTIAMNYNGDAITRAAAGTTALSVVADSCALAYAGTTTITSASSTLSAALTDTEAPVGNLSGHTVVFTVTGSANNVVTYSATTNSAGVASTTAPLNAGPYTVTATVADNEYGPCSATPAVIGATTGAAAFGAGSARAESKPFQFAVALFAVKGAYHTLIAVNLNCRSTFHAGSVTSESSVANNDVKWTGTGVWGRNTIATFTIEVTDNHGTSHHAPDTINLVIRQPSGATLFTTAGAVGLTSGIITVR